MSRFLLWSLCVFGFVGLTACTASHMEDPDLGPREAITTIDLTAPGPEAFPQEPVLPQQQEETLRSVYPVMRGYRVDKNVIVYPLDDWQPVSSQDKNN